MKSSAMKFGVRCRSLNPNRRLRIHIGYYLMLEVIDHGRAGKNLGVRS
jgi:hypothetical protein